MHSVKAIFTACIIMYNFLSAIMMAVCSALFEAVEHQDMDRAKEMLDINGLDVNW